MIDLEDILHRLSGTAGRVLAGVSPLGKHMTDRVLFAAAILACAMSRSAAAADEVEFGTLEKRYTSEIRPLVVKYCQQCHSTRQAEAELNLASFPRLADVRKHP